jgi:nucleoside-diphosphate-sugar epimerase
MNILITGGSGFLGKAIVTELFDSQSPVKADLVRVLDVCEFEGPEKKRIDFVRGDVTNYQSVLSACQGIDLVIHSAAIIDWGTKSDEEIYAVNVGGTENVIKACKVLGIQHLIYTSSLDAIYGGKPLLNIDESLPYPEKHPTSYCRSKYLAEKLVLEANSKQRTANNEQRTTISEQRTDKHEQLVTCALRPSDIYGEGDPYHIGALINMAKGGFYVRLGNGKSKSQHVYVRNMAYAHLQVAKAMLIGNTNLLGKAYLITDGPGGNFFHFFDRVVEAAGYKIWPKNFWIPRPLGMLIGTISEGIAIALRPFKKYYPKMSRFAVTYTCTDFTFGSEKARRDFGFVPKYSEEEAFEKTVRFYKQ